MDYLTKDQVDVLKQEIDILISNKYQSKKNEMVRESTLLELEKRKITPEDWLKELKNLRELHLTLACEPSRTNIQTYGAWAKKNLGNDVILDINIDPKLVAGAQIIWNGKYQDHAYVQRLLS